MVISRRFGVRVADFYFDESAVPSDVDLARYHYWSSPVEDAVVTSYSTVLIDVERDPAAILGAMPKSTRYEIRRAEAADRLLFRVVDSDDEGVRKFLCSYRAFARAKQIVDANSNYLSRLVRARALVITSVRRQTEEDLCWHVYAVANQRARLLYSASRYLQTEDVSERQFFGRANRFHHWQDILYLRQEGIRAVDLGGICEPCDDRALMGIRSFKASFGGEIVRMFDATKPISVVGRIALQIRKHLINR